MAEKEKAPEFTIAADDPAFLRTVNHYLYATSTRMDMAPKEREERIAAIEKLQEEAHAYQVRAGIKKPALNLARDWNKVG